MGWSSFFRRIKKILSPEKTVFFMRENRFFRYFCLKESSLTAEKNFFLWGLLLFLRERIYFCYVWDHTLEKGRAEEWAENFARRNLLLRWRRGVGDEENAKRFQWFFCVKETSFVENGCYILRISKDREEQKESRDFVRKKLLFVRKAEAFVNDE